MCIRDRYMGIGISGGEKGALYGPSIMAGGSPQAWECVRAILEAIAARHQGKACCGYIAEGGAGHYVKMVHNGIEYAVSPPDIPIPIYRIPCFAHSLHLSLIHIYAF